VFVAISVDDVTFPIPPLNSNTVRQELTRAQFKHASLSQKRHARKYRVKWKRAKDQLQMGISSTVKS